MGHQFSRATPAAALAFVLAACGGGDGAAEPLPVLDNARQLVTAPPGAQEDSSGGRDEAGTDDAAASADGSVAPDAPDELPPPDRSTFEGALRVVNIWVDGTGTSAPVDVWARRSFTAGPVLLAEEIGFGEASPYFSTPPGASVVVVGAGAGPDGDARAEIFAAASGEQITTIFTNGDVAGGADVANVFERGAGRSLVPPTPDHGLVVMTAPNLNAFSDRLVRDVGGDAFYVGDGSSECRTQRGESDGFPPDLLGGAQPVELELPEGSETISLHPWFSADECDQPSALDLTVDVAAGETVLVIAYTRDGSTVEALTLEIPSID